jgi:hypothetical protein
MKFNVKADKMLFVDGKIKSIEAGELTTTDEALITALEGAKDVEKVQRKKKQD